MGAPLKKQGGIFLPRHNEACHPVEKAQYLGDGAQRGEKQRALPGGQHFFRQDNPPSRQSIREGVSLSVYRKFLLGMVE